MLDREALQQMEVKFILKKLKQVNIDGLQSLEISEVLIQSKKCPGLNGEWIVKDLMGSKHTNRIDFLLHKEEIDSLKFWMPHRVEIVNKKDSLNPLETLD